MRLIFYIIVLSLATWIGLVLYSDPGYLLFSYQQWVIEMPIWLAMLASFVGIVIIYCVLQFLINFRITYRKIKDWILGRSKHTSEKQTTHALLQLGEGRWKMAEQNALRAAKSNHQSLVNYLLAARAGHEQKARDRRDQYLKLAFEAEPKKEIVIGLTQAQLLYQQGQFNQCLVTLKRLQQLAPAHKTVLKLLTEVYQAKENWEPILQLLPNLKRYHVFPAEELDLIEDITLQAILRQIATQEGKQALMVYWQNLSKKKRERNKVIQVYVQSLVELSAYSEAEKIIRLTLKRTWDMELVKLYGFSPSQDIGKQISIAEGWLKNHAGESMLLLTLARLCLRHQLWGKARNYLEASIEINPCAEAYAELGRLLGYLGESDKSRDCYQKGLFQITDLLRIDQILPNTRLAWEKTEEV